VPPVIFRVFHKVQECELGFYYSDLEALKLDFDEHLRTNPNSEIIGELKNSAIIH
jgi:hypothetical protein